MKTLMLCRAIILSTGLCLASLTARADFVPTGDPVPLKGLLEGGSISSCDKVFTNWTFSAIGGASSLTFSVIPGYDEFGPGFRLISDDLFANTNTIKDVLVGFKVTSNGPKITDVHLRFGSQLAGNGHTSVVEQARNGNGAVLGQVAVFNPPPVFEDTFTLTNSQSLLFITKDILMVGGNNTNPGASTITFVDQTFSQEGSIVCSISGPATVCGGTSNHEFSGPAGASTYSWNITGNGVINGSTTGQNISVTAGASGSFTVHLTVLNGACQSSTCEKTVTITENPVCEISGNPPDCATTATEHSAPAGMSLYAWSITGDATITGATNQQTVTVQPTNNCSGSYTLFLTISNGCSATCQKTFTYGDTTKPQITRCPQGSDLGCNPETLPTCDSVKALVTATDNCGTPTLLCQPASSIVGCNVELSFTIRAVDACGNESDPCIVTYTYHNDTVPPSITCPQGGDLGCNPQTLPDCDSVKAATQTSDNCGTVTLSCESSDSQDGCTVSRTFTLTATDACNNTATCTVVYTWTVDTTPPALVTCLPDITVNNLADVPPCSTEGLVFTDNCGTPTVSCNKGDLVGTACNGSITFTYTAQDDCGNTATCTRVVTIRQEVPCAIEGPDALCTADSGSNTCSIYSAADNGASLSHQWSISGNGSISGSATAATVYVCAGNPGSFTLTLTVTNEDGCTQTCTKQVTVNPRPDCSITGPDSVPANSSGNEYVGPAGMTNYLWTIFGDGTIVGPTDTRTISVTAGSSGSYTVCLSIKDANGCYNECCKQVTIEPPPCQLQVFKECVLPPPPPPPFVCKDAKPIDSLTMRWGGTLTIGIKAWKGPVGSTLLATINNIAPGDLVTVSGLAGSPNDVVWEIFNTTTAGPKIGTSTFHLSCSDEDMNGPEDCGKFQGNGKGSSGINLWIFEGMAGNGKTLECNPNPAPQPPTQCCTITAAPPPSCETEGKPTSLTFRYTGGGCAASANLQGDKFKCTGAINSALAATLSTPTPGLSITPNVVPPGGTFTVSGKFPAQSTITMVNSGGTERLSIHTSCSKPLAVGDVFGDITLVGFNGKAAGNTVTYRYIVKNVGGAAVNNILLLDDKLGTISPSFNLPAGGSMTFEVSTQITQTTTNTATAIAQGQNCQASSGPVVVKVLPPPPPPFVCKDAKPIDSLTMRWGGTLTIGIKAWKGPVGSTLLATINNIAPGDLVTVSGLAGSPNDVVWEIFNTTTAGPKIGTSTFHLSCSDEDMNGPEDCGKFQGNGKGSSGINLWIFEGMSGNGRTLNCGP